MVPYIETEGLYRPRCSIQENALSRCRVCEAVASLVSERAKCRDEIDAPLCSVRYCRAFLRFNKVYKVYSRRFFEVQGIHLKIQIGYGKASAIAISGCTCGFGM